MHYLYKNYKCNIKHIEKCIILLFLILKSVVINYWEFIGVQDDDQMDVLNANDWLKRAKTLG